MRKTIFSLVLMCFCLNNSASAQKIWGIVLDRKTTRQVTQNSGVILGAENFTNSSLNKSEEHQSQIQKNVIAIQAALEIYRRSYENVNQFGLDNKNVKEIARLSKLIVEELKATTTELRKNPKATLASQKQLLSLTEQTAQCVKTCYSLVTKSTVKQLSGTNNEDDGLNWLNPKDRLLLGNYLIARLDSILFTLIIVKHQAEYANTWGRTLQEIAPYDWARVLRQKETADNIIKSFSKK
ncbi:MAG: hypothetical protein Q4G11_05335 [Gallicola sp.]|nr:hypothetical protein [Gallicola sp.]